MINNYSEHRIKGFDLMKKAKILLTHTDNKTYKVEEVVETKILYAVYYKDTPVNIRQSNSLISYPGPQYMRNCFSNIGHAYNLAERLNKMFNTNDFVVCSLKKDVEFSPRK